LRRIIIKILTAILVVLISPFILYVLPFLVGGNGGFIVMSGSMRPVLNVGDIVITQYVNPENLKIGDIITFKMGEGFMTHRIIDVKDGQFETKGDDSEDPDVSSVKPKQIRGKLFFAIPFYGYIIHELSKGWMPLLLILIPAVMIIFGEIKKIRRELRGGYRYAWKR